MSLDTIERRYLKRPSLWVVNLPKAKSHSNYKPAFVNQLGKDQCPEIICDENGLRCGGKITRGTGCDVHAAKNYRGMTKAKLTCTSCIFFMPKTEISPMNFCNRFPPVPVHLFSDGRLTTHFSFPVVSGENVCGEHKKIEAKP